MSSASSGSLSPEPVRRELKRPTSLVEAVKDKEADVTSNLVTSQIIDFICDEHGIHIDVIRDIDIG